MSQARIKACCVDWWYRKNKLPSALASQRQSCAVASWGSAPCVDRLRQVKYWIVACGPNPSKNAVICRWVYFVGISPRKVKFRESSLLRHVGKPDGQMHSCLQLSMGKSRRSVCLKHCPLPESSQLGSLQAGAYCPGHSLPDVWKHPLCAMHAQKEGSHSLALILSFLWPK